MATTTQMPAEGRTIQPGAETKKTQKAKTSVETGIESAPNDSSASGPAHAEIAQLAYSYWLERGDNGDGSAEEDWLRAESQLKEEDSAA